MRAKAMLAALAAVLCGPAALNAQPARPPGVTRIDLQHHDLSIPGREVYQLRVDFAPGSAFPRHRHPGEEIIYVIEGAIEYQLDGEAPVILKAGDVLFVPDGAVHSAKNAGDTNAAELGTYVVEKGKPLTEIIG